MCVSSQGVCIWHMADNGEWVSLSVVPPRVRLPVYVGVYVCECLCICVCSCVCVSVCLTISLPFSADYRWKPALSLDLGLQSEMMWQVSLQLTCWWRDWGERSRDAEGENIFLKRYGLLNLHQQFGSEDADSWHFVPILNILNFDNFLAKELAGLRFLPHLK